jgi:formylglycine-generating enzyme required for sulfatase activity
MLGERALAPPRAVRLLRQLLDALDAAHRAGLVHADVKPGNAIVVGDGADERLVLVDFGLARLRRLDAYATSVGGTPAFMAPEQLCAQQVDARSDQFSAALVLVKLLTGWHRQRARELAPPGDVLDAIADPIVRAAVARALAIAPDERFATAAAFAAALVGELPVPPSRPAFRGLAAFTEDDRGQLHGRDAELARITELALYRRITVVTAPSGVGKTSLLRAGVVHRLTALTTVVHYASCRSDDVAALREAFAVPVAGEQARHPLVILLDQVEAALDGEGVVTRQTRGRSSSVALLDAVVASAQSRDGAHAVLCVREDFLARLLDRLPDRGVGVPTLRVGPLELEGARAAILRPLAERQLAIEPALLDELLADLVAAGRQLGVELGWAVAAPVYPPHLQLACAVLCERLAASETTLAIAHYRGLGGFAAIVGEHLERVLDALGPADETIARDVFLALVGATQLRTARSDAELADAVGEDRQPRLAAVLETLQQQGLIVRTRRPGGDRVWELIHDSLVPRVVSWIDRHDLSRRRAIELVRHHLRRTRPDAPSLLSRAELRELDDHADAIAALDAEWRRGRARDAGEPRWTPAALVARSRQVSRRSVLAGYGLGLAVVAGLGAAGTERWQADRERRAEAARRDADLGLASFELTAFDWDAAHLAAVSVPLAALPALTWSLRAPSFDDPDEPGEPLPAERFQRFASATLPDGLIRIDPIEAPGGAAFLIVSGRGRAGEACASSVIPLRGLPGYARRGAGTQRLAIHIPTCQATRADMIEIPAGPFIFGGVGEPRSDYQVEAHPARAVEHVVETADYWIDRAEVTNAAYAMFSAMHGATGIRHPASIPTPDLAHAGDPDRPVSSMIWREAKAYCAFLGKHLVTSIEWEKAMRGGVTIAGRPNPSPRRNFPWGTELRAHMANLAGEPIRGVQPAGRFVDDRSPYGVVDLAGNLSEWVGSALTGEDGRTFFARETYRVIRGGNWSETVFDNLLVYTPIENTRPGDTRSFTLGMRCADGD